MRDAGERLMTGTALTVNVAVKTCGELVAWDDVTVQWPVQVPTPGASAVTTERVTGVDSPGRSVAPAGDPESQPTSETALQVRLPPPTFFTLKGCDGGLVPCGAVHDDDVGVRLSSGRVSTWRRTPHDWEPLVEFGSLTTMLA